MIALLVVCLMVGYSIGAGVTAAVLFPDEDFWENSPGPFLGCLFWPITLTAGGSFLVVKRLTKENLPEARLLK